MSVPYNGDQRLEAAVNTWLKLDKNPTTHQEVLDHISAQRWQDLSKTMLSRMKFGTAGLRGRMAAGFCCMNDIVILQTAQCIELVKKIVFRRMEAGLQCSDDVGVLRTAQGLCSYVQKVCSQAQLHNGVVIGYDGRYNSKRFAELTAKVFVSSSVPVQLFSSICPTPLVSFATIQYRAAAGVMVTASHNPKEDNGYKVYWGNGSQIITPHDDNILDEIRQCLDIPEEHWDISGIRSHPLVKDCTEEVTSSYMSYIKDSLHPDVLEDNRKAALPVVYSAMHGVGYQYILKAFEVSNLSPPISTPEQQEPDPEFPTVKFPNPEEPGCLRLSTRLAEARGALLVLANDPDADRLAVAEYDTSKKTWKVFTGNEMGALLGWWVVSQHYARHPAAAPEDVYVLASVVSSKMLRPVLRGKGEFVETLTGFKWMGNCALLLEQQNKFPVFAFEEAIGYMCDPRVPDKDGVSAAVQVASLASHLRVRGSSLQRRLQELYEEFGHHASHNSYYICHDPATIQRIFRRIRNYHGPGEYPRTVCAADIVYINDYTAGVQIPERRPGDTHLKVLGTGLDQEYASGEMIQFVTSGGLAVTVRTSGTEPKIKYYTERVCATAGESEQEQMKEQLKQMVQEFVEELLQPKENGLIAQA